tara:strand:+ start:657 stop:1220 length:564 start_codon:yes stop_codon:yes gene_type:complete
MKYSWYSYPSKLNSGQIDDIVKVCLGKSLHKGEIRHTNTVNLKVRKSSIAFLDRYEEKNIYDLIYDLGVNANNQAFGFDVSELETVQFTLYDSSDKDKYDWHIDTTWFSDEMCHRKVSVIIQLSDPSDYEGGVFEVEGANFSKQDKINNLQKGTVIAIPSFIRHRVTPVTKGKRMSLIGWVLGAKFR